MNNLIDYNFKFTSGFEYALNFNYFENNKFFNMIVSGKAVQKLLKKQLPKTAPKLSKDPNKSDIIDLRTVKKIIVPEEYKKYVTNVSYKIAKKLLARIRSEYRKKGKKSDIVFMDYEVKNAYFERQGSEKWQINIEAVGRYSLK